MALQVNGQNGGFLLGLGRDLFLLDLSILVCGQLEHRERDRDRVLLEVTFACQYLLAYQRAPTRSSSTWSALTVGLLISRLQSNTQE